VLLILLTLSSSLLQAGVAPPIEKGFLDLRAVDLSQGEPIELAGEWEFYWDLLINSSEARTLSEKRTYRTVPLPWSESRSGYPAYPAFGKASYRLRILLPAQHPTLLLRIPETFTAFNVYINDQKMPVRTEAGVDAASTHATRRTVYVPIESSLTEVDLVFQVANYVSGTGGIWRAMSLGNTDAIMDARSKQQFQMLLAVSALGVMCAYHFILFLFRRDHLDNLWFSLFCFAIFVRSFLVGNDLMLYNLVEDFDWTWSRRIEFISFYWAVALSVVFIRDLFPQDMKALTLRILLPIITLATLIVLTQPHVIFRKTLFPMQIVGIVSILFCLLTIIFAVIRNRPQARTMMGGFLMMATGTIHDILNSMLRFDALELASVGVIGCVVTTSIVISKRFSMTFDELRIAQEAIRVHNEQLDQLVKEKTLDIRSIFANIPQAIFAIQRDGRLNAEVSDYFRDLFQPEPLMRARDLLERIFDQSQLSADQVDQIANAVDFCLDGKSLSFDLNAHVFPHQLIRTIKGEKRSFEMDWDPIVDEGGNIQKLLICMRDTTELNELRIKTLESEKRVKILAELLDKDHGQVMSWLEQAIRELEDMLDLHASGRQSLHDLTRDALRLLHTQKGNARSLGLGISASSVHACEQALLQDLNFAEVLAGLLHELMFTRDILKSLHIRVGLGQSQTTSLCTLVANALEQLAPLALRLKKELPECHGLDLLQSHTLRLTPELAYMLRGALNHILTNIMDHGLETRDERTRKGKPVRGSIAFHLFEDRQNWALQISDDGRGLPRQALEDRLKKMGREVPREAEALAQVLLEGGLSTKDVVNDISGRGLGLDAVAAALEKAGGTLRITTRTRSRDADPQLVFTLELPKTAFAGLDHAAVA
jgi:HPt (histidine-containing phosphotransfer) domain-containing protein